MIQHVSREVSPRAYVRDPVGNLVEVMACPPDTVVEP
jgi:hypothetical protein